MLTRLQRIASFVLLTLIGAPATEAASLSVQDLTLAAGDAAFAVVEGSVQDGFTYGTTIIVEIVRRPDSQGTLTFTPAPPTDIALAGTPWLGTGRFTPFDTDMSGSSMINGAVIDNGNFVPSLVTYDGTLVGFMVVASPNAFGTWNVVLSTSAGDSSWEGLPTTLEPATIMVSNAAGIPAASAWALAILSLLLLVAGTLLLASRSSAPRVTFE